MVSPLPHSQIPSIFTRTKHKIATPVSSLYEAHSPVPVSEPKFS